MVGSWKRGRRNQSLTLTLKLLRQAPDGALLSMTLRRVAFHSCLTSTNFVTIPARITRAPATTPNRSGCDVEQAMSQTKKRRDFTTHLQDPATTWHCCRAAAPPPR
jgi:hypothetical protein